jgi:arylsulfatase A-like enzyme
LQSDPTPRAPASRCPLPWAVALALAAGGFLLVQGLQPCDDAYITFRHARNLALEARPAWNLESAPVLGSTSPLFVFLLGGLGAVFGPAHIESLALGVNAVATFALVLLAWRVARDLCRNELAALLAAALVGFNGINVFVFSCGFEAALFCVLLLAGLQALRSGRDGVAVLCASAAPLLRPEGVLLTPLVWGYLLLARRLRPALLAFYLPLPLLWMAFATPYYGSPVPHSIEAKRHTPAVYRPYRDARVDLAGRLGELPAAAAGLWTGRAAGALFSGSIDRGVGGPRHQATQVLALAGLGFLTLSLLRRRDGRLVHLLYPPGFVLLYAWIGRTEVWYFPSFVTAAIPALFAGLVFAASRAAERLGAAERRARSGAALVAFALLLPANAYVLERADPARAAVHPEDPRGRRWQRWERERFDGHREAARLLNAQAERGAALASEVGVFGYFYDGDVIDAVGLCSPEVLRFYPPPASDLYDASGRPLTPANTIIPSALVEVLAPQFVVSSATYMPHLLRSGSAFLREYAVLARTGEAWSQPLLVFQRFAEDAGGGRSWFAAPDPDAFTGSFGPWRDPVYDVVAGDMDLDGDPDLLINWHHLQPLELFENRGGRFALVEPARSGLSDNRGVPDLYADADAMRAAIEEAGEPGLFLWHDVDRQGSWRFLWAAGDLGPLEVEIETNHEIREIRGLAPGEGERPGPRRLRVRIEADRRAFAVGIEAGTQIRVAARTGGGPAPLRAGSQRTPLPGGQADLWLPDPHGMAWLQTWGSPHPELFITRGGIMGSLRPPLDPKRDRYYLHRGSGEPIYRFAEPGTLPPDYGRGRRAEWVDVDADGRPELSITHFQTPNALLAWDDASQTYRDRAPALGLDLAADVGIWGDVDDDGDADFVYLESGELAVARNRGPAGFEHVAGPSLGLVLGPDPGLQESTALHWADFDNDGALDLWVLSYSDARTNHLFRREDTGFRDVSAEVGLDRVRGNTLTILADFDNDAFLDVASFGRNRVQGQPGPGARPKVTLGLLWRNHGGRRFDLENLGIPVLYRAGTALDADGDGRTDLVLVGRERHLLRNEADAGDFVDVRLEGGASEPVGARVRAYYDDGSVAARRWGSAHSSYRSQSILPLRFGVPEGVRLTEIGVRWPGGTEEIRVPVSGRKLRIDRKGSVTAERQRPDVLLVVLDTVRPDRLTPYGHARPTAPALAELARRGVLFEDVTAPSNWTWPSHASLFTGLPPWEHGAHFGQGEGRVFFRWGGFARPMRRDLPTLAERFASAGYRTVFVNANPVLRAPVADSLTRGFQVRASFEDDRQVLARARQEIERPDPRPVFLFVNLMGAHNPYTARPVPWLGPAQQRLDPELLPEWLRPARMPDRPALDLQARLAPGARPLSLQIVDGERALGPGLVALLRDLYDGELARVDAVLAELLRGWEAARPGAVVAVTSDHGEYLGEHGLVEHTYLLYTQVLAVPLVLRAPGLPEGLRVPTPVSLQDLHDTLLELALGEPGPASLVPLARGEARDRGPIRAVAYPRTRRGDAKVLQFGYRYQREGDQALVLRSDGRRELYDLASDPGMERDLAEARPERAAELAARAAAGFQELRGEPGAPVQIPPESRERLRALGYTD